MATQTYFLPPDFWSYPAATDSHPGAIRLGQLISNLRDPSHTIGTIPPLDMAGFDMPVQPAKFASMDYTDDTSSSHCLKLFVRASELLAGDFHANAKSSRKLLSAIEEVEAQTVDPKDSYVRASMEQSEVQNWLQKKSLGRHRVFMVSTILIARPTGSSTMKISGGNSLSASGEAEGHDTASQTPLSGGAGAGRSRGREFGLAFVPKTPFIYGFKIRECFFKKGQGSSKAFYKGAQMHANSVSSVNSTAEELVFGSYAVAKEDIAFENLGDMEENFEEVTVSDTVSLLVPKAK